MTDIENAVAQVLNRYNVALNKSSTEDVMPLYADDGVFMPPYRQSAVGRQEVKLAYDQVFGATQLTVVFHAAEIVEISDTWAFARTNSTGHTLDRRTGRTTQEANQELFLFHKDIDGAWKIARYSFSSINPAPNA